MNNITKLHIRNGRLFWELRHPFFYDSRALLSHFGLQFMTINSNFQFPYQIIYFKDM